MMAGASNAPSLKSGVKLNFVHGGGEPGSRL